MSLKKINIAIIGFGEIGHKHFNAINKLKKNYKILAIVDQNFNKQIKVYAKNKKIKLLKNIESLFELKNIDYAAICLPSGEHYKFIKKTINNNINVICEKPLVLKCSEIKKLKQILKKNKRIKLFEVKQLRFSKLIENISKVYKKNKLGNIHFININIFINRSKKYFNNSWRGTKNLDGGVLFNQLSHHIDLIFYMFNPKKITKLFFTSINKKKLETEDAGLLTFKINNSSIVNINYSLNSYKNNFINSFNGVFDFANFSFNFRKLDKLQNFIFKNKHLNSKFKKSFEENDLYVKFYEEIAKNYLYGNKSQKLSDIYDAEKVIKFNEDFYNIMRK